MQPAIANPRLNNLARGWYRLSRLFDRHLLDDSLPASARQRRKLKQRLESRQWAVDGRIRNVEYVHVTAAIGQMNLHVRRQQTLTIQDYLHRLEIGRLGLVFRQRHEPDLILVR